MQKNIFPLLLLLFACKSNQHTIDSSAYQPEQEKQKIYIDSKSRINYSVANDQEYLYLTLYVSERPEILKILRTGLTVYFDPLGKKGKGHSLRYPLATQVKFSRDNMPAPGGQQGPPQLNLEDLLTQIPGEATFNSPTSSDRFDVRLQNEGIQVEIVGVDELAIEYRLKFPLDKLVLKAGSELTQLNIGIVSGSFELPQMGPGPGRGGGSGFGAGGGRRPPGGRPGGGGGPSRAQMQALTEPVKFWFLANLYPSSN